MLDKKTLYIGIAAVFTFILFVFFAQSFLRSKNKSTNDAKTAQSATVIPRPTNSAPIVKPYVNTLLTPPPFDTITITFTPEGTSVEGDKTTVTTNDVISIVNQDAIQHSVRIQEKEFLLAPGSAYGYPVTATNTTDINVVLDNNITNTYTYEIQ